MTQAPLTFHVDARATADGVASVEAGGTTDPLDVRWDAPPAGVDLTRQEQPPRLVTLRNTMRVVTDEPERRLLHAKLREFGTVYNTLAAVCDVQRTVEAVPRA